MKFRPDKELIFSLREVNCPHCLANFNIDIELICFCEVQEIYCHFCFSPIQIGEDLKQDIQDYRYMLKNKALRTRTL